MMQEAIYSVLSNSSEVSDICGSRIYPKRIPQGATVPSIVYTINDITPIQSLNGESGLDAGTVEIVCWAKNYSTAHELASAVRSAFVAAGIAVLTENMQDVEDEETHNFGVLMIMNAWSDSDVGNIPVSFKGRPFSFEIADWILENDYYILLRHYLGSLNPLVLVRDSEDEVKTHKVEIVDSNTVKIWVPSQPDLRFNGSVSVAKT